MVTLLRALPWVADDEHMLGHLAHFEAANTAAAMSELEKPEHLDVWLVFHFPDADRAGNPKAVLYGRGSRFRERGYDSMVRQLRSGHYVLVVRRYA